MTEKDISEILKNSAPGAPRMADLGDRVRRGHRRRRTIQVATAGVAVLALGIPAALQVNAMLGDPREALPPVINPMDPSEDPEPSPTQEPTQAPTQAPTEEGSPNPATTVANPEQLVPEICEQNLGLATDTDDALVPEGATRVWLCSGDQEPSTPLYGAPEPLVGNIDDVIRALNEQPLTDPQEACGTGEFFNWSYLVVLEYPDREPFVVSSETDPCIGVLNDGTQQRGDGQQFFLDVRERFFAQRQNVDFEYAGQDVLCPEASSLMSQSIYDGPIRGVACGVEPDSPNLHEGVIAKGLDSDVVQRIQDEATANAEVAPATGFPPYTQTIQLANKFGDPYTMYRMADESYLMREGVQWMTWMPSEELAADLGTYFEGTRTEPFDDPYVDNVCMNPDYALTDFPVEEYVYLAACVGDGSGQYSNLSPGTDQGAAWIREIEAAGEVIAGADEPDFTGHLLVVVDTDGRVAQLYVATNGDLVWDTDELMSQELRMRASPSASLLAWMREVGINV